MGRAYELYLASQIKESVTKPDYYYYYYYFEIYETPCIACILRSMKHHALCSMGDFQLVL